MKCPLTFQVSDVRIQVSFISRTKVKPVDPASASCIWYSYFLEKLEFWQVVE